MADQDTADKRQSAELYSHATERFTATKGDLGPNDDEIDILGILATLWLGKWTIAVSIAVAAALASLYLYIAPPIYQSDAVIRVEDRSPTLMASLEKMLPRDSQVATEIEILRSRQILGEVVSKLDLDIKASPNHFPFFGQAIARRWSMRIGDHGSAPLWLVWVDVIPAGMRSLFGVDTLHVYDWGGADIVVTELVVPQSLEGQILKLRSLGKGNYQIMGPSGDVLITGKVGRRETAILNDRATVAVFVQKLIAKPDQLFNIEKQPTLEAIKHWQSKIVINEKKRNSSIIELTAQGGDKQLLPLIVQSIAQTYVRQNAERSAKQASQSLDFLESQIPELREALFASEANLNDLRSSRKTIDLQFETQSLLGRMVKIEEEIAGLEMSRRDLLRTLTQQHPRITIIDDRLKVLRADLGDLDRQTKTLPQGQKEVLRARREVEVNQAIYLELLNTQQELKVAEAGSVGNVFILDPAAVWGPVAPRSLRILALSLLIGAALSSGLVLLWARFRRVINTPEDVDHLFSVPTLATVPASKHQRKLVRRKLTKRRRMPLLSQTHPDDPSIESLRSLRTALRFMVGSAKNNVVLVSGPVSEVGKSWTVMNFASVLAQSGQKVLVIDADMRAGSSHLYTQKASREPGLSDFLAGDIDSNALVQNTNVDNLSLISCGRRPPNAADLLLSNRFAQLLDEVKDKFDHVVIDTPPVLQTSDPLAIAHLAGIKLLVLWAGRHSPAEVSVCLSKFHKSGENVSGFLINGLTSKAAGKSYYGYYGYKAYGS